ncbi:hypothetical protein ABBQ32_004636 [Trebouxia sp. C0010 RCD-2024]
MVLVSGSAVAGRSAFGTTPVTHQPSIHSRCANGVSACGGLASVVSRRSQQEWILRRSSQRAARSVNCTRAEAWNPPTVSDTKRAFYESFKKPIPPIYNTVIQELLVQQHLLRWNFTYKYDEVFALGFVSVFDQITEGLPGNGPSDIFNAYMTALQEDPEQYREDAKRMEEMARQLSDPSDLTPTTDGNEIQKLLGSIAERAKEDKFLYTKFFAIGLFRLLELTGAKDPKALETLVKSMNVKTESVNRDLTAYKGILSKLNAAKELMAELMAREKRKQEERKAEKEAASKAKETAEAKA